MQIDGYEDRYRRVREMSPGHHPSRVYGGEGLPEKIPTVKCLTCGREVTYASITRENGELGRIALDPTPPVYHVAWGKDGSAASVRGGRGRVMVAHAPLCR